MVQIIDKKVSVLMPVYNGEKHLRDAIDSILSQTMKDFELLIINDGSTDNSEKIILSYDDCRIRYIKNEENSGIVFALNRGLAEASAPIIARMDADDISYKERFQIQYEFLMKNPEIGVCGTFVRTFGNAEEIWQLPVHDEEIKIRLLFRNAICHPTVMFRKEVLEKLGLKYSDEFKHQEDYFLWWQLRNNTSFANLPRVLLDYRLEGQNITAIHRDTEKERIQILFRRILKDSGLELEDETLVLHYYGMQNGYIFPSNFNMRKFRRHIIKISQSPALSSEIDRKVIDNELKFQWRKTFTPVLKKRGVIGVFNYWFIGKSLRFEEVRILFRFLFKKII